MVEAAIMPFPIDKTLRVVPKKGLRIFAKLPLLIGESAIKGQSKPIGQRSTLARQRFLPLTH
jgi:hypothetical protein